MAAKAPADSSSNAPTLSPNQLLVTNWQKLVDSESNKTDDKDLRFDSLIGAFFGTYVQVKKDEKGKPDDNADQTELYRSFDLVRLHRGEPIIDYGHSSRGMSYLSAQHLNEAVKKMGSSKATIAEIEDSDLRQIFEGIFLNPVYLKDNKPDGSKVSKKYQKPFDVTIGGSEKDKKYDIDLAHFDDSRGIPVKAYYSFAKKDEYSSIRSPTQDFYSSRLEFRAKPRVERIAPVAGTAASQQSASQPSSLSAALTTEVKSYHCKVDTLTYMFIHLLSFPRLMDPAKLKFHRKCFLKCLCFPSEYSNSDENEDEFAIYSEEFNGMVKRFESNECEWNYERYPTNAVFKVAEGGKAKDKIMHRMHKRIDPNRIKGDDDLENQGLYFIKFDGVDRRFSGNVWEIDHHLYTDARDKYLYYDVTFANNVDEVYNNIQKESLCWKPLGVGINESDPPHALRISGFGDGHDGIYEPTDELVAVPGWDDETLATIWPVNKNKYKHIYQHQTNKELWLELTQDGDDAYMWAIKKTADKGSHNFIVSMSSPSFDNARNFYRSPDGFMFPSWWHKIDTKVDLEMNSSHMDDNFTIGNGLNLGLLGCETTQHSWSGCHATIGVKSANSQRKFYFEVRITGSAAKLPSEKGCRYRIGWSTANAAFELGKDVDGFGYENNGNTINGNPSAVCGGPLNGFNANDVVSCMIDFDSLAISYAVNGKDHGKAFDIPLEMKGCVFFPAIAMQTTDTSTPTVVVNFGSDPASFQQPLPPGYIGIGSADPASDLIRSSRFDGSIHQNDNLFMSKWKENGVNGRAFDVVISEHDEGHCFDKGFTKVCNPGARHYMRSFTHMLMKKNMYLRILNNFLMNYVSVNRTIEFRRDLRLLPVTVNSATRSKGNRNRIKSSREIIERNHKVILCKGGSRGEPCKKGNAPASWTDPNAASSSSQYAVFCSDCRLSNSKEVPTDNKIEWLKFEVGDLVYIAKSESLGGSKSNINICSRGRILRKIPRIDYDNVLTARDDDCFEIEWDRSGGGCEKPDMNAQYKTWLETHAHSVRGGSAGFKHGNSSNSSSSGSNGNNEEFNRRAAFFALLLDFWFDFEPIIRHNVRESNPNSNKFIMYYPQFLSRAAVASGKRRILDVEFEKSSASSLKSIGLPQLYCVLFTVHHVLRDNISCQIAELRSQKKKQKFDSKTFVAKVLMHNQKITIDECVDPLFLPFNVKLMQQPLFDLIRSSLKTINRQNNTEMEKFRVLVNIWLMYITPWNFDTSIREVDIDNPAPCIYDQWEYYIAANYHFYTTLLVMFLEFITAYNFIIVVADKAKSFQNQLNFDYIRRIFDVFDAKLINVIDKIYRELCMYAVTGGMLDWGPLSTYAKISKAQMDEERQDNHHYVKAYMTMTLPKGSNSPANGYEMHEALLQHHYNVLSQTKLLKVQDDNDMNNPQQIKMEFKAIIESEFVQIKSPNPSHRLTFRYPDGTSPSVPWPSPWPATACVHRCSHTTCILHNFYLKLNTQNLSKNSNQNAENSAAVVNQHIFITVFDSICRDNKELFGDIMAYAKRKLKGGSVLSASAPGAAVSPYQAEEDRIAFKRNKIIKDAVDSLFGRPGSSALFDRDVDDKNNDLKFHNGVKMMSLEDMRARIIKKMRYIQTNCAANIVSVSDEIRKINEGIEKTFADQAKIIKQSQQFGSSGAVLNQESAVFLANAIVEELDNVRDDSLRSRLYEGLILNSQYYPNRKINGRNANGYLEEVNVQDNLLKYVIGLDRHDNFRSYENHFLAVVARLASNKISKNTNFAKENKIIIMIVIICNYLFFLLLWAFNNNIVTSDESETVTKNGRFGIQNNKKAGKVGSKYAIILVFLLCIYFFRSQNERNLMDYSGHNRYVTGGFSLAFLMTMIFIQKQYVLLVRVFGGIPLQIVCFLLGLMAFFAVVPTIYKRMLKPLVYIDLRAINIADYRFWVSLVVTFYIYKMKWLVLNFAFWVAFFYGVVYNTACFVFSYS